MRVLDKQSSYYLAFDCPTLDGRMKFNLQIGGLQYVASTTSTWNAGEWYHIAGTYDGTNMKIYVNGDLENIKPQTGSIGTGNYKLFLGSLAVNNIPTNMYFDGAIDEVRIYDHALSDEEVQNRYFRASICASPTQGIFPLEVQFSAVVEGGLPPYSYEWDIDGDGLIDNNINQSLKYIYTQYGTYLVNLTVKDARDKTGLNTVSIHVLSPPAIVANGNPSIGIAPLSVNFSASGTDPDGSIVLYEWDFNGDGTYDWSSPDSGSTSFQYQTSGLYQAALRVTDNDGLTDTDIVVIAVGISPTAIASADFIKGATPLAVTFTGTGNDSDGTINLYE